VARIALWLGLITLAVVAIGLLGARIGVLPPLTGFLLFGAGMALGSILTLLVGLVGIIVTRARAGRPVRPGRKAALQAVAIGGALLIVMAILASRSGRVPPIHDITTNIDDPPRFVAAARAEGNQGKNLDYPQGNPETPALQKEGYPDLEPIGLDLPPAEALERARKAAEDLGWHVVEVDPNDGRLEATFTSRLFRFVDDIVVRIRPTASGSIADVRSTSRVGESDLGANAKRIRSFREHVTENE
jgi:uncharacterized protein (DUF1499 family)